jgi:hypothetical protein
MNRRALTLAFAAVACTTTTSERLSMGSDKASDNLVRKKAPRGAVVLPAGCSVPGVELFWVSLPARGPDDARGYGVAVVGGKVLSGSDGLRALFTGPPRAPVQSACAAALLVGDGGAPIADLAALRFATPEEKALARAPSQSGDLLEWWSESAPSRRPGLRRYRLSLSTLALDDRSAAELVAAAQDPIERARALLASESDFAQKDGIALARGRCAQDPHAVELLGATLRQHANADTRARAADALAGCKSPAAVAALVAALGDPVASVREFAAASLGVVGDASARSALERVAASDPEPNPRSAARRALGKLPK